MITGTVFLLMSGVTVLWAWAMIGKAVIVGVIISALALVALGTIVFSDVDTAAAIAGIFSVINVVLNGYIMGRLARIRHAAEKASDGAEKASARVEELISPDE